MQCLRAICIVSLASMFVAQEINNDVCSYRKYTRAGDVKFLVVAGIRENDGQGACGRSSRSILEQIVALEWIVSFLNENGSRDYFIPGMSIGKMLILDICTCISLMRYPI